MDTLNNLEDVNIGAITPLATNDILVYDGVTSSWVNTPDTGLGYLKTDGTNMMLADLNINNNKLTNTSQIVGTGDISITPIGNVVLPTGQINCGTPLQFGLFSSGPNGVNQILFNYDDTTGEYILLQSADIPAVFIDP